MQLNPNGIQGKGLGQKSVKRGGKSEALEFEECRGLGFLVWKVV